MDKAGLGRHLGVFLLVLSFVFYGLILLVPFLPLGTTAKVAAAPVLALLGELAFWPGSLLVGKEIVARYKAYLDPRKRCTK
jgi:hypothetical protein